MTNNTTVIKEYSIPEWNIGQLEQKFAGLQRRALRLGVEAPRFEITGWTESVFEDGLMVGRFANVVVSGVQPRFDGWDLMASINHDEAGNLINTVPGAFEGESLYTVYGDIPANCEHCHTLRLRTDTFLLRNTDGTVKQVGRNCLAAFLHRESLDPNAIAGQLELILGAFELGEEAEDAGWGRGRNPRYPIEFVLAVTAMHVRTEGYLSKGKAEERGVSSTSERVRETVSLLTNSTDQTERRRVEALLTASDSLTAQVALGWAENIEPSSDFEHNIKIIANKTSVDWKQLGYTAAIIAAYNNHLANLQRKAMRAEYNKELMGSVHVGLEKSLMNFADVKVLFYRPLETEWGVSHLYKMLTVDGNVLVTFYKGNTFRAEVGETIHLRCKIKRHSEYEGVKQTEVTHVSIINEDYARTGKKAKASSRSVTRSKSKAEKAVDAAWESPAMTDEVPF